MSEEKVQFRVADRNVCSCVASELVSAVLSGVVLLKGSPLSPAAEPMTPAERLEIALALYDRAMKRLYAHPGAHYWRQMADEEELRSKQWIDKVNGEKPKEV